MYDDYADYDNYPEGEAPVDDYVDDWYGAPQPRGRRGTGINPKIWIGLLVVVVVIALGAGAFYLARYQFGIINSPEDTTERFYTALNRRDYGVAADCVDPADTVTASVLLNTENLLNVVFELLLGTSAEAFDIEIPDFVLELFSDLEWEFRDMTYTTVAQSGDQATVRASGVLYLAAMGFEFPAPWSVTHELIRIDGDWYLRFNY